MNRFLFVLCALGAAIELHAHEHTAPWLDESALDQGLYVELRHPRVIRNPSDFDVTVAVNNLLGPDRVSIREIRYVVPGAFDAVVHPRRDVLRSRRLPFRQYQAARERLHEAAERGDRDAFTRLTSRSQSLLRAITSGTVRDGHRVEASFVPPVGSTLRLAVEIDVVEPSGRRTLRRTADILVAPPLPDGDGSWFAGDQHLHTAYSIDAFFFYGTRERVAAYARAARTLGLDWIIVSDHTNLAFLIWYRPILFRLGELEARGFRDEQDYLVLQGLEMGAGARGPLSLPAHVLAYPRAEDSTGFLENPCPGLLVNFVNCEPEQVVLDRINDHGGIAFLAHPLDSSIAFASWDRDGETDGWAGLEIFSADSGSFGERDQESVDWWHELLNAIAPPMDGELALRPGYPTRFPVGLGNSDAHEPGSIGRTFSYCWLPDVNRGFGMVPREVLMDAFVSGRCVASNGPLVYGEVNGAGTGEVALVPPEANRLTVTLETTPELGPVADYEISVLVDGVLRTAVPLGNASGYEATVQIDGPFTPPDKFVTLQARSASGAYLAITNPIWLEHPEETDP